MKLNFDAMQFLMGELQQQQMWVLYLMGIGKEMTDAVTKVDLTKIINVLCKKLNWIEEDNEESIEKIQVLSVDQNNTSKDATEKLQPAATSEGFDDNLQSRLNLEEKTNKLTEDQAVDTDTKEIPDTLSMTMSEMVKTHLYQTDFSEEGMQFEEKKMDQEKHSLIKVQPDNPISEANHTMPFIIPREDIEFEDQLFSCTLCEQSSGMKDT